MKKILYVSLFLLLSGFSIQGYNTPTFHSLVSKAENGRIVYICTGKYAKVYHSYPRCRGLGNCKGDIKSVYLEQVSNRRACKICY